MVALWIVEQQVMLETWVRISCEAGVPVKKVSDRSTINCNRRASFHTFNGVSHSRMY